MEKDQLICMEAVARHLSLGRAARELGLAQSTVSRRIAGLEQAVGLPLFIRKEDGVALTAAGRRLLRETTSLVRQEEKLLAECRAAAAGRVPTLRVTFGSLEELLCRRVFRAAAGRGLLPDADCFQLPYWLLLDHLRDLDTDAAFCPAHVAGRAEGLETLDLCAPQWRLCARADHPVWDRPAGLERLQGQTVLAIGDPGGTFEVVTPWLQEAGARHRTVLYPNYLQPQLAMLRAGAGVALLPPFAADALGPELRLGEPLGPRVQYRMVWDKHNTHPALEPLAALCREIFEGGDPLWTGNC